MEEIRYEAPRSLARASELLREPGAKPLAGGTDLIVQMRTGRAAPQLFVDVKRIPELAGIRLDADGIFVGAAVPAAEIVEHAELARIWPGLAEAVDLIGSLFGKSTLMRK